MRLKIFSSCFVLIILALGSEALAIPLSDIVALDDDISSNNDTSDEDTTDTPELITTVEPITIPEAILPIVTIAQGTVVGFEASDGNYFEFHGIPYADSTSGLNRYKAPMPPPSFEDTFIANRKDIKCVRALGVGYEGTEDCLIANVYTPIIDSAAQLPVMVWVKGREFDGPHEPELSFRHFIEQEVIIVSLNYRESVLGFLCLGTETAPGNAGLKDIIAGLEWVRRNIEQFGGDPNNITLFGHGSGAAAVDLVTLSPMANGLVHKAIAQSGNAMAPWAVSRDNLEYAIQVAEALGHSVTDIQQLSQIFMKTSIAALMGVINELDLTDNALAFSPCIEKQDLEGVQPFLVKTPFEIISNGEFLQIPFITGFVDNEGTVRAEEALENNWLERMDESFYNFLQPDLKFQSSDERIAVAEYVRHYYFEDDPIDLFSFRDYIAYHGETMILVSSIREVRTRALVSSAPTYLYQFSYRGSLGEQFVEHLEVETAAHSEELAYMFYSNIEEASDRDLTIAQILVERWTNFAKTGIPSSLTSQQSWQPFTSENSYYLRILASDEATDSNESTLEESLENPHSETILFWDEIYEEHFLDAVSSWDLTERNEDEDVIDDNDDSDESDNENNSGEENNGEESNIEEGEDAGEGGAEEDGEDNSASKAVGSTFLLLTLFSLLNKFHCTQLVS